MSDGRRGSAEELVEVRALLRAGRRAEAEAACTRLVVGADADGETWLLLGSLQLDRGDVASAGRSLARAVDLRPRDPAAALRHAVAVFRGGDIRRARALLEAQSSMHPADAAIAFHLGLLLEHAGDVDAAVRAHADALARDPRHREARLRIGLLELGRGRPLDARAHLEWLVGAQGEAVAEPLARACLDLGDADAALVHARDAVAVRPQRAQGHLLEGIALRRLGRATEARRALQAALALAPDDAVVLSQAGCNLRDVGEFERGQALLVRARERAPQWNLLRWLHELALPVLPVDDAQARDAVDAFGSAIADLVADLDADRRGVRASALEGFAAIAPFALHYLPVDATTPTLLFGDLAAAVVHHALPARLRTALEWQALAHRGRVRVGFVSAELRAHTITRYFGSWIEQLDRRRFEVHAWHLGAVHDALTARIAAGVHAFYACADTPIEALATLIRSAQLDVLVYLEIGMDSRQSVLGSLRLAPVQCAAYGHPATTGLHGIDVFLGADAAEPAGAQAHYRERLERLPGLGVAFEPPPPAGDGTWLPRSPGRPTLMCLQSLFKLVPAFDDLLARIVAATDATVVFFESPPALGERFLARAGARLAAHGLDPGRHLVLLGRRSHADYLGGIAAADVVLDSTVFCGGATSLDALSVGTPLVTLEGEFMRGRQGAAMLRLIGADALVATTPDDYVRIAIELCRDEALRAHWRDHLLRRAPELFARADAVPALEAFLERAANEAVVTVP
ncbi:MAG: tetratricopeptide repeat protein [Xanthomonadales bacterium]|nr:tetratricopeptide repeat protein [Xanthomonadales bacterium]